MKIANFIHRIYMKFIKLNPNIRIKYLKKQGCKIGDNCTIFSSASFGSEPYLISIGDNVKITDGVRLVTHDGGMHVLRNLELFPDGDKFGEIKIGNNVFICINSIIVYANLEIGDNCVIGAGSVVTHNISKNSVVAGVPAKTICDIDEYYSKNINKSENTKHMKPQQKKDYLLKKISNL